MSRLERAALATLAAAGLVAVGVAHDTLIVLPLLIPTAASVLWGWERSPRWIQRGLAGVAWIALAAAGAVPLAMTFYAMPLTEMNQVHAAAGTGLCLVTPALLLAGRGLPPAATVIPASLGLLVVGGLRFGVPQVRIAIAAAGIALVVYLVAWKRRTTAVRVVFFATGAAATAAAITVGLPWLQPHVESAASGLLGGGATQVSGLSLSSRLGDVEQLALSPRVALRVWSTEPQDLRARVKTRFDGRVWYAPPGGRTPLAEDGAVPAAPTTGREVSSRILVEEMSAPVILAPARVVRTQLPAGAHVDEAGILAGVKPRYYTIVNRREGDLAQEAEAPDPACLEVHATVDPRLRGLAAQLGQGDAEERVRRTAAYLGEHCRYSLKVGAFRSEDPVGEFVFDKKRGYCEYFASATVVLLRLQGVPARYVLGFGVRESNKEGDQYVVRDSDAHAWAEAYVPGRGWVAVDATPADQYDALRAPLRGGSLMDRLRAWWAHLVVLWEEARWHHALILAVVVGAVMAAWKRPRRPARRLHPVSPEARRLLEGVDRRWKKAGCPRPAWRAPMEHAASVPPELRESTRPAVEAFYRCVYGGVPLTTAPAPPNSGSSRRR